MSSGEGDNAPAPMLLQAPDNPNEEIGSFPTVSTAVEKIKDTVGKLFLGQKVDRQMHLSTLNATFECVNRCLHYLALNGRSHSRSLDLDRDVPMDDGSDSCLGYHLYKVIKTELGTILDGFAQEINSKEDVSDMIETIAKNWELYWASIQSLDKMCSYINRHLLKSIPHYDKVHNRSPILIMCAKLWKTDVMDKIQQKVGSELQKLFHRERFGESIEALARVVTKLLLEIVDAEHYPYGCRKVPFILYDALVEQSFLTEMVEHYQMEFEMFKSNPDNSMDQYFLATIPTALADEDRRSKKFLLPRSLDKIETSLKATLVGNRMDELRNSFQDLVSKSLQHERKLEEEEHLGDIHLAVGSKFPELLDIMKDMLQEYVKKQGIKELEKFVGNANKNAGSYVRSALKTFNHYKSLVDNKCLGNIQLHAAVQDACEDFINENTVTASYSDETRWKSAKLLVHHLDLLLSKEPNCSLEISENDLNEAITFFKFLKNKDAFQKYYSYKLRDRLLKELSKSNDAEELVILMLKNEAGLDFVKNFDNFYKDATVISADLMKEFIEKPQNELSFQFKAFTITQSAWPSLQATDETFVLPTELEKSIRFFGIFYNEKFKGRNLKWLYNHSRGELSMNKYTIRATAYQMAVLLCFNGKDKLKLTEISESTGLEAETIVQACKPMITDKLLGSGEENLQNLGPDSSLQYNNEFQSNRFTINLIKDQTASFTQNETEHFDRSILKSRKFMIDAAMVRVMKAKQTMNQENLIVETIREVRKKFTPEIGMMKTRLQLLVDRKYLTVDETTKMYTYVA